MKTILLIFASAAINGLTTYAILNYIFKSSLEEPKTPSDSAEDKEEEEK